MTVKFTVAVVIATGDSLDRESDHDYHTGVASPLVASPLVGGSVRRRSASDAFPQRYVSFFKTRSAEAKM